MDKKVISCAFNIDTARVEVKYADGSMIAIDCTLVEAEVARNMYESSELEWVSCTRSVHSTVKKKFNRYPVLLLRGNHTTASANVPFPIWAGC